MYFSNQLPIVSHWKKVTSPKRWLKPPTDHISWEKASTEKLHEPSFKQSGARFPSTSLTDFLINGCVALGRECRVTAEGEDGNADSCSEKAEGSIQDPPTPGPLFPNMQPVIRPPLYTNKTGSSWPSMVGGDGWRASNRHTPAAN